MRIKRGHREKNVIALTQVLNNLVRTYPDSVLRDVDVFGLRIMYVNSILQGHVITITLR